MTNASSDKEPSLHDVVSLFKDYSGDESGGVHAIRGFTFQVWLAVLEVLKAHATGEDYAVVLEYQQDIAVLDSSTKPTKVKFIQAKKHESSHHWTLHALLAGTADDPGAVAAAATAANDASTVASPTDAAVPTPVAPAKRAKSKKAQVASTLAKLYFHRRRFGKLTQPASLEFTSDAPFHVGVGDDGYDETVSEVVLSDLTPEALAKVDSALRRQLEIPADEALNLSDFMLRITNCPLEDGHKYVVGELVELCQNDLIGVEMKAPLVAVYLVASYVRQRAGSYSFCKDFPKLLTRAVTRTDVNRYFAAANDSHERPQALIEQTITRLNAELVDFEVVRAMQSATSQACLEVANRAGMVWPTVAALAELAAVNENYKAQGLVKDRMARWLSDFKSTPVLDAQLFDDGCLYCLMAMILNDAPQLRHLSAPAAGPQPEAEQ